MKLFEIFCNFDDFCDSPLPALQLSALTDEKTAPQPQTRPALRHSDDAAGLLSPGGLARNEFSQHVLLSLRDEFSSQRRQRLRAFNCRVSRRARPTAKALAAFFAVRYCSRLTRTHIKIRYPCSLRICSGIRKWGARRRVERGRESASLSLLSLIRLRGRRSRERGHG